MVIKPPPPTSPDNCKQQSIVNFGRKTKYSSRPFTKNVEEGETKPVVKQEQTNTVSEGRETRHNAATIKSSDTPSDTPNDTPSDTPSDTPTDTPTDVKLESETVPELRQSPVKLSPPHLVDKKARRKKKKPPVKEEKDSTQKLTDFYQVRRSSRQPLSKIKDQEYQSLVDKVKRKCHDGLEVKDIMEKGRGVFSKRDFVRKEFVVEYSGKLITYEEAKKKEIEYSQHPEYGCYMYYFQFKNKKYCIDGTAEDGSLGRLLNHSVNGNVESKVVNIEDKPVLLLVAKTDIPAGTELVYDYGERNSEVIKSYPWLKY